MLDLKKQKEKKCVLKPSVRVRKNECRKRNDSKNDAKRSFFRKKGGNHAKNIA